MVANPYNAHISNDPNDCKYYVPSNPWDVEQCKYAMGLTGGSLLFWDYHRYGECNPYAENCNMSLQPADKFHVYTIKAGVVGYNVAYLNHNYEEVILLLTG